MRSRGVLPVICVLVALGLLLCAGKESQAKQPASHPNPPAPTPQRPAGRGSEGASNASRRAPGAESGPGPLAPNYIAQALKTALCAKGDRGARPGTSL